MDLNKYYEGLGYTEVQAGLLSEFSYGGYRVGLNRITIGKCYEEGKYKGTLADAYMEFCKVRGDLREKVEQALSDGVLFCLFLHAGCDIGKFETDARDYLSSMCFDVGVPKGRRLKSVRGSVMGTLFGAGGIGMGTGVGMGGMMPNDPMGDFGGVTEADIEGRMGGFDTDTTDFDSSPYPDMDDVCYVDAGPACSEMRSLNETHIGMPTPMSFDGLCLAQPGFGAALDGCGINHANIQETDFAEVSSQQSSTFRTTCNTASCDDIIFGRIGEDEVDTDAVRVEEFLNWYDFDFSAPDSGIKITHELSGSGDTRKLLVGLRGGIAAEKKQNITLLVDVSGSMVMTSEDVQAAIFTILSKLRENDILSIVTYSSETGVVLSRYSVSEKTRKRDTDRIIAKVFGITIDGYTNGSDGLKKAYDEVYHKFDKDAENRVVIFTDGDFNFGDNSVENLAAEISRHKEGGAHLTVVGCGRLVGNDEICETLSKNGNGCYCCIEGIEGVDRYINKGYHKIMHTVALNVKAQVEFNPKYVKRWKLEGYENRRLEARDFRDDSVVAEPFGSGAQAVALYELELGESEVDGGGMKYMKPVLVDSDELCTIRVRYEDNGTVCEETAAVKDECNGTHRIEKAVQIAELCGKLRNGDLTFYMDDIKDVMLT